MLKGFKEMLAFMNPFRQAETLDDKAVKMLAEIGAFGVRRIKQRIEAGQIGGPALSEVTKSHKSQRGLDARRLIATGAYLASFRFRVEDKRRVYVGAGSRYQKLSRWLEFGTNKIPARPHLRPALKDILPEAQRIARRHGFKVRTR